MNKRLVWFIIAVAAQLLILAAVPAQKIRTRTMGKTIFLKTAPVDPYSIMSGYYVVLSYEISNPAVSIEWKNWLKGSDVWVVLKSDSNNIWDAVSVHKERPAIPDGCIVIKGKATGWRIEYGIESYFIPEEARHKVESDFRSHSREAKAEVKVDSSGNAALIKLIIQDRVYAY